MVFGSVLGPNSQRANETRIGMLLAGMPVSVPCRIVNRQAAGLPITTYEWSDSHLRGG